MKSREICIEPNGLRIQIDAGSYSFCKGDPYLYIIQHDGGVNSPIYIGETGKSNSYTVVDRVRYHFQKSKSSTLNRVYKNSLAFNFTIPDKLRAHLYKLPNSCVGKSGTSAREDVEAWVIHILCHQKKVQSELFCVSKFSSPKNGKKYESVAERIVRDYL